MKKIVMAMLVVGLMATGVQAQGALIQFIPVQTAPDTWEIYVDVSGPDTVGLSGYALKVNAPPGSASYDENVLFTLPATGMVGMQTPTAGDSPGGYYSIGNYQVGASAIEGIGMVPVDVISIMESLYPSVHLDAHALLGTLTTNPVELTLADFTLDGDGGSALSLFLGDEDALNDYVPRGDLMVEVIPEPITLSLLVLGAGGLSVIRRIRRRR